MQRKCCLSEKGVLTKAAGDLCPEMLLNSLAVAQLGCCSRLYLGGCCSRLYLLVKVWSHIGAGIVLGYEVVVIALGCHSDDPKYVLPIAEAVVLLFIALLVVPDEVAGFEVAALRAPVADGPHQVDIIILPRLYFAEDDVAGSDYGDAGLERPNKTDIAAVDERPQGSTAALELNGSAGQKAFLHQFVAFVCEELPQLAILVICPVLLIFFRDIVVGRDDIVLLCAVDRELLGVNLG